MYNLFSKWRSGIFEKIIYRYLDLLCLHLFLDSVQEDCSFLPHSCRYCCDVSFSFRHCSIHTIFFGLFSLFSDCMRKKGKKRSLRFFQLQTFPSVLCFFLSPVSNMKNQNSKEALPFHLNILREGSFFWKSIGKKFSPAFKSSAHKYFCPTLPFLCFLRSSF